MILSTNQATARVADLQQRRTSAIRSLHAGRARRWLGLAAMAATYGASIHLHLLDAQVFTPVTTMAASTAAAVILAYLALRTFKEGRRRAAELWTPLILRDEARDLVGLLTRAAHLATAGSKNASLQAAQLHAQIAPRLQALVEWPLGSARRYGYYPLATDYYQNTHDEYDGKPGFLDNQRVERHRERFTSALDDFREAVMREVWQDRAEISRAMHPLIPAYRAMLMAGGINVPDIAPGAPHVARPVSIPVAAVPDIPAVEAIRTKAEALRAIDVDKLGDDRRTVDRLIDEQMPAVLALHRAADAASDEAGRTESRRLLTNALASIDRALQDVLERHAANLRDELATRVRYLETSLPA